MSTRQSVEERKREENDERGVKNDREREKS